MTNSLLHIGLHVLEEDVQKFYLDILNCEPKNNFTIQAEDAFLIFGISREVRVQLVSSGGIELELFIDDIKNLNTSAIMPSITLKRLVIMLMNKRRRLSLINE